MTTSGNRLIAPTYDFNYQFEANWQPIYILGRKNPQEVHLMDGTEEMSFVRDSFTHIQFSGEDTSGSFITGDYTIDLFNYKLVAGTNNGSLQFDVSGSSIIDTKLTVDLNNFVRTATTVRRFY